MSDSDSNKKITSKQVVALLGVILLVALYIVTLVMAFFGSASGSSFMICLAATIIVPILIWLYSWIYARINNKRAIGDKYTDDSEEN